MEATVPFWQDEPYTPFAPLEGDASAEVCVIGAGIGGIATAWHLGRRGIRALVLEAREVASGASGRNGGFFLAGAAPMYDRMRDRWGRDRARRIYAATLAGQEEMLRVAEGIGARGHFRLEGLLRLGVDAAEADDVRRHHAALREDGFAGELVEEDDLPPALRRPGRLGLSTPHDGGVHPVRWLRALAGACGADVREHTRVLAPPEAAAGGVTVRTERGTVHADRVVVAMDGGLAALVPAASRVRSRRLNMVATAPVGRRVLPFPVYARDGYEYAQQLPDGRVTLGGFSDVDGARSWTAEEALSEPAQARLDGWLREELGVGEAVTHRWVGIVGYAEDPLPSVGFVPGTGGRILALGGYNGTGHVQGYVAARIVAELLTTGASADADLYAPVA